VEHEDKRVSIDRRRWRKQFNLAAWLAVPVSWVGFALPIVANILIIWICERTTGRGPTAFLPGWLATMWLIGTFVLAGVLMFVFYTASYGWISRKMEAGRSRRAVAGSTSH
jgi:hypothetical protein